MRNRLQGVLLICLLFLAVPAHAQGTALAKLTPLQTESFPRIETYLHVVNPQGMFLHHLQPGDLRLQEDGQPLAIESLEEQRNGVQFVVALNPGHFFGIRNSKGETLYDFVARALAGWAKSRQGSTMDDLSLVVNGGEESAHLLDPLDWLKALQANQVDLREAVPNLDTLFRALEIAADAPTQAGLGRAVLFITSPVDSEAELPLQNLISRAREEDIPVSVWMVASGGDFETTAAERLKALAVETGGQFFAYSGDEDFPSPEEFLEPLRSRYYLVYQSRALASGAHQVSIEVTQAGETIASVQQSFDLSLLPPNPAFVTPTLKITRRLQSSAGLATQTDVTAYLPAKQELQVVVDFPDGRVRPLAKTSLYVDGNLVATNTQPPFDKFTWDLSDYTTSGEHPLRVEAVDVMGLSGTSLETIVQILVEQPDNAPLRTISRQIPLLAGAVILLVGSVAFLVMVLTGRIQPYTLRVHRAAKDKKPTVPSRESEKNETALPHTHPWTNRIHWPQRRLAPQAYAYLARVHEFNPLASETPIPITAEEITLGSDPNQATLVLNDPSVDGLHARLTRDQGDHFRLHDEGSVAGTWVNYTLVSSEGCYLSHGDLIHIGRTQFRFTLRPPGAARKPVVIADELARESGR